MALTHFPTYHERLREYSRYVKARELRGLPLDIAIVHAAVLDAIEEQERIERESERAGQERIAERELAETRHVAAVAVDPGRFRREPTAEQLAFRAMRQREAPMQEPAAQGTNTAAGAAAIIRAGQRRHGEID